MRRWMVLCLLVMVAVAGGCGSGGQVDAAVNAVEPKLRSFYSYSYAGVEVDGARLIVYRKPNASLDEFVREQVGDVDVEFRDAPYALDALQPLADRVNQDRHYWQTREFPIKLAVPRPDGTGVNVFVVTEDLAGARAEFQQRYGKEPLFLDRPSRTGVVPAG